LKEKNNDYTIILYTVVDSAPGCSTNLTIQYYSSFFTESMFIIH